MWKIRRIIKRHFLFILKVIYYLVGSIIRSHLLSVDWRILSLSAQIERKAQRGTFQGQTLEILVCVFGEGDKVGVHLH
jgi:hypothetical protein